MLRNPLSNSLCLFFFPHCKLLFDGWESHFPTLSISCFFPLAYDCISFTLTPSSAPSLFFPPWDVSFAATKQTIHFPKLAASRQLGWIETMIVVIWLGCWSVICCMLVVLWISRDPKIYLLTLALSFVILMNFSHEFGNDFFWWWWSLSMDLMLYNPFGKVIFLA